MRSRLEADFAAYLDRRGDTWKYEPGCFASSGGQWLPDFRVDGSFDTGRPLFIELKPYGLLAEWRRDGELYARINSIMRKMMVARESDPGCHLWLIFWAYGGEEMQLIVNAPTRPEWIIGGAVDSVYPSPEIQAILEPQGN
jgi:hypothetical protein